MSLRWKGSIGRRFLKEDGGHATASDSNKPISRRVELELGVKAISGLPVSQPSSPTSSGSDDSSGEGPQTTLCVTWRKNGKLEHGEDKRRQREGTTLTAKVAPDGTCSWDGGRMTVVPCHIRKFDSKADVCDHKTVTFYVNQVVGSRAKKLKKIYEATLDLDRLTLYPTYSEEHLVLRPLGLRNKLPSHDIAWLLIQVRVLNFKALPTPSVPAVSSPLGSSHDAYQLNPREMPITSRTQSIGSIEGELSLGKAARRLSQQLVRVRSMPGEEGKPKESQGEADGEEGNDGDHGHDHNHRVDDEAERKRLENEEAERYIQLYLDGYKKKQVPRQSQDHDEQRDSHHQQHDHQLAPPRSSSSRRSSLEAAYNEKIAHYEGVLQQMQETREQMHHEIDELMRQLEETKLDAARLLRELELREAPPAQGNSGGEEGPDEPLREETARMVDDLRALIIEREDQLAELRSELGRRTAEIDALMRERDDEAAAARDAARQCEDLRAALEANELERNEVQSTLDQVLGQASAMHEELMEKQARLAELEDLAMRSAHDADADADAEAQLELERLREVIEAHRQAVDELTRRLAAKRKRNAECKQHIAELEESMVEKQAELDMMTRNRNALYQRCEELEADRERVQLEQEAERAAKEDKRSQKAAAAAAAALEQAPPEPSSSQAKLAADRRLLHELGEAKKQLRQRRQEVVEFDQILAEMANASRASEAQVASWEHQLLACRQRITELGSPVGLRETNERGSRVAISECEADVEVLQRQVMAELDGMRELAQRYEQVKQQRDEAARACDELAHAASAIKQRILTSRKRSKAQRSTSMTGMTSRARSNGNDLAGQVSHDNAPALDKLVNLQWELDTRALIERHVWSYDPTKRQAATARTAVKEILGQLQVFQPRNAGEVGGDTLTPLVHGLMRALARSHKRASGLEEQIHWLSFTCHLLHGLKSNPESASFFHPAVYYSVPDPAESGVGVAKVKFRVQQHQHHAQDQGDFELAEESSSLPDATLAERQPTQTQVQAHDAEEALTPNYMSFLWLQKLHNLVLRIYRVIVALACASIEPVIAALMQPKQQLPPPSGSSLAQSSAAQPQLPAAAAPSPKSTGTGGGEGGVEPSKQAAVHHEATAEAGIRMFARSTRETLRGLGFMKAKLLPEAPLPAPDDDYETSKCVREFKGIIGSLFELLIAEGIYEAVVIQLCKQLFHHLDVSLFNRLLTGNDLVRSPAHAVKIKYFLSQLVDWCLHDVAAGNTNAEHDGDAITLAEVLQLSCTFLERHTAEAASLLVMDKERILEEGDNLRALFSHLNGHQIIHLLEKIHVDEPSQSVASGQRLSATPRWMVLLSRLASPHPAAAASTAGDLPTPTTTTSAAAQVSSAAPQASQGLSSQPLQLPTSLLSFQSLPN